MIKPLTLVLSIALVLGSVSYVSAQATITQQLRSLSEIMSGNYEQTYPLVRCAALYQSSIEWAGKDRIGNDVFQSAVLSVSNFIEAAVLIRMATTSQSQMEARNAVLNDTRAIADIYLTRYRDTYARTGEAWATDDVWRSDSEICKILASDL